MSKWPGVPLTACRNRADLRPEMVGPANALADRLADRLAEELRTIDREEMRCALLTLAWRVGQAAQ
jgi:hypothetical protein